MKAAIVLLADHNIQNAARKLVIDMSQRSDMLFYGSLLPAHISLKQPFAFEDLDELEAYFDSLAKRTAPVEITLEDIYYGEWPGTAIIGYSVRETPLLRSLHNQLNVELLPLFKDTAAAHDGEDYRFHLTIELGTVGESNPYRDAFERIKDKKVNLTFTARSLGLFYYARDDYRVGSFTTYRISPLGG
jgi:2'-5' RNA ligase